MFDLRSSETIGNREKVDLGIYKDRFDPLEILGELGVKHVGIVGNDIMCHCPFPENHKNGDANPSFGFNPSKLVYNCFTCGPGSLLSLIKRQLGLTDKEAEKWLRERCSAVQRPSVLTYKNKFEGGEIEYPLSILDQFKLIHPYLYERGITKEVIIEMTIGYDEKHDAIVIPHIFNGKLKGWQWRHLSLCNHCGEFTPKYKSTKGFPKKTSLYNYDNIDSDEIIVVESPFTVLKLKSFGITNVVATFGSWSTKQMDLLKGYRKIILWPDNDTAGDKNIGRVIDHTARIGFLQIAPLVPNKGGDPGDLTKGQIEDYLSKIYSPLIYKKEGLIVGDNDMFTKYGDAEKAQTLEEETASKISSFSEKTGKNLENLDDDEREELHEILDK